MTISAYAARPACDGLTHYSRGWLVTAIDPDPNSLSLTIGRPLRNERLAAAYPQLWSSCYRAPAERCGKHTCTAILSNAKASFAIPAPRRSYAAERSSLHCSSWALWKAAARGAKSRQKADELLWKLNSEASLEKAQPAYCGSLTKPGGIPEARQDLLDRFCCRLDKARRHPRSRMPYHPKRRDRDDFHTTSDCCRIAHRTASRGHSLKCDRGLSSGTCALRPLLN
jgi:hypothetical protein